MQPTASPVEVREPAPAVGPLAFFEPAHRADPWPSFAALRAAEVVTMPGVGVATGRHALCSAMLRSADTSSERRRSRLFAAAVAAGVIDPDLREQAEVPFLFRDPPDHTRLRALVSKAFTRRVVADLEPRVAAITDRLLDAARDRGGPLEIVADLAYPLPVQVICALLGVPEADHDVFAGWSQALARSLDPDFGVPDPQRVAREQQVFRDFDGYFRALAADRRAQPREDLLTGLVHATESGTGLTETELTATCMLLLVAGHETTVSLVANAVQALLTHPAQWAALVAEPALAEGAAEETLRYDPPVQLTGRIALRDIEVAGRPVGKGELVLLVIAAAGRDESVFPDPDRFDIARTPDDGALRHLAFSAGVHFCLGAPLARLEATIALRALSARLSGPRPGDAATYRDNIVLRGLAQLPVDYDALA